MASIFNVIPVPVLDQKQTEMLVVGLAAAVLYMVATPAMGTGLGGVVTQRR